MKAVTRFIRNAEWLGMSVAVGVLFVVSVAQAATTISTNISTGGTLSVTGASTLANASTTLFSSYGPAYFGGSATSSFSTAGALTLATPLAVGSGGMGISTLADGALVFGGVGGGTANLASLATSTSGSVLQLSFTTGRPTWVATSTLGLTGASLSAANTWTALQQFQGQASTTLFSSYGPAYFGGSATSSFSTAGALTLAGNLTVPAGYSLDTAAAGILNLGTTTATTINIGGTQATTKVLGLFQVPAAFGIDTSAAGVLNIGTTTATTINIGGTQATTKVGGNLTIPANFSIDTAAAGTLNIGTTTASAITIGKSGVTTNNPGLTTMTNASTTQLTIGGSTGTALNAVQFGSCTLVSVSAIATSTTFTTCTGAGTVDTTYKVVLQAMSTLPAGLIVDAASTTATAGTISVRINNADAGANTTTGTPSLNFWAFK